jgi:hypothetical protein
MLANLQPGMPAKVLVLRGRRRGRRDWRWLWLRRRDRWEVVYAGVLEAMHYTAGRSASFEFGDPINVLRMVR